MQNSQCGIFSAEDESAVQNLHTAKPGHNKASDNEAELAYRARQVAS